MTIQIFIKTPYPYAKAKEVYQLCDQFYAYGIPYTCLISEDVLQQAEDLEMIKYIHYFGGKVHVLKPADFDYADQVFRQENNQFVFELFEDPQEIDQLIEYLVYQRVEVVEGDYDTQISDNQFETTQPPTLPFTRFFDVGNKVLLYMVGIGILFLIGLLLVGIRYNKKKFMK